MARPRAAGRPSDQSSDLWSRLVATQDRRGQAATGTGRPRRLKGGRTRRWKPRPRRPGSTALPLGPEPGPRAVAPTARCRCRGLAIYIYMSKYTTKYGCIYVKCCQYTTGVITVIDHCNYNNCKVMKSKTHIHLSRL